jgi:hypothetical protein
MSLFASLTATEYWKHSDATLADMSTTAITLAAPERPSMMRRTDRVVKDVIDLQ